MMTTEDMQEFDNNQRIAQGEPVDQPIEPDVAPDEDYADMPIEARNQAIDGYWDEYEQDRRDRAALFGPDAYWR